MTSVLRKQEPAGTSRLVLVCNQMLFIVVYVLELFVFTYTGLESSGPCSAQLKAVKTNFQMLGCRAGKSA